MAARQGPNIFSMRGRKNRRERKKETRETWFKLQQFCISHQENGIRFHRSDLIWYSSCRDCISYQDKWEITGKHLERDSRIVLISARLQMLRVLCHGEQSGNRTYYDDHLIPKVSAEIQVLLTGVESRLHTHTRARTNMNTNTHTHTHTESNVCTDGFFFSVSLSLSRILFFLAGSSPVNQRKPKKQQASGRPLCAEQLSMPYSQGSFILFLAFLSWIWKVFRLV